MKPTPLRNSLRINTTLGGLQLVVFLVTAVTGFAFGQLPQAKAEPVRAEGTEPRIDRYGDPLPAAAIARLGTVRLRHVSSIEEVISSPDGKMVAAAGYPVLVWDPATGREIDRLRGKIHAGSIEFLPDGQTLVGVVPPNIRHWNTATGELVREINIQELKFVSSRAIGFSADGRFLAASLREGKAGVWETATGKQRVLVRLGVPSYEHAVAVSPDGGLLALAGPKVQLWDVAANKERCQLKLNGNTIYPIHFSPDGKKLAAASGTGLQVWDTATGNQVLEFEEPGLSGNRSFAFSPDSSLIAVDHMGAVIHLRDAAGKIIRCFVGHGSYHIGSLAFSSDGKMLVSSSRDRTIGLWDVATGKPLHHFEGHQGSVVSLAFSPDGQQLASGGYQDGTLIVWDLAARKPQRIITGRSKGPRSVAHAPVQALAYSPDGKILAAGEGFANATFDWEASVHLYRMPECQLLRQFVAHYTGLTGLAFSPDGKSLVTTGVDRRTWLWEVNTGKRLLQLRGAKDQHRSVAFSRDGHPLLSVAAPTGLSLWRVDTVEKLRDFGPQETAGRQKRVAGFSNGGKVLISQEVRFAEKEDRPLPETFLWDVESGKLLRHLKLIGEVELEFYNTDRNVRATVSPDGKLLAVCMGNYREPGTIHLHDIDSGKLLFQLRGHQGLLTSLEFSPNGKMIASGNSDTTVLLWDVSPLRLALEQLWTEERSNRNDAVQLAKKLVASKAEAIPFLKQYLQELAVQETRYENLIADLNCDRFDVRERATRKLAELGAEAELALALSLQNSLSPEARRRIEEVLDRSVERLHRSFTEAESQSDIVRYKAHQELRNLRPEDEPTLRRLRGKVSEPQIQRRIDEMLNRPKSLGEMPADARARSAALSVAILEEFGTPEARRVLEELTLGPLKSTVTREAKASLARLGKP